MAPLDWLWMSLLTLGLLQGLWRGLTQELLMLVGWVLVLVFSSPLALALAPRLPFDDWAPLARQTIAFVLAVSLILLAARSLGWVLRKAVVLVGLGWLDRLLGAGLGFIRLALMVLLMVWVGHQTPLQTSEPWTESQGVQIQIFRDWCALLKHRSAT